MNKLLIITLALLLAACQVEVMPRHANIDIYCDSNGDEAGEYVDLLNQWRYEGVEGMPNFRNHCLAGLSTAWLEIPQWLAPGHDTLVVLNTTHNDVIFQTPLWEYADKLGAILSQLDSQGVEYVCVLASDMTHANKDSSPYRAIQMQMCSTWIDSKMFMHDGLDKIHMGPEGQALYAAHLWKALEEVW